MRPSARIIAAQRWALAAALPAVVLAAIGCGPSADTAAPSSQENEPALPTPARPQPKWNCGEGCWREPGVPKAAVAAFNNTVERVDLQPKLVYPLDGAVHPINLSDITVQFERKAANQRWFDIRLSRMEGTTSKVYNFLVPCTPPPGEEASSNHCTYPIPPDLWSNVAEDNAGRTVSMDIGATASDLTEIQRSASSTVRFSADPISGGFYYWSTALRGTYRLPFGARQAVPWITPQSASNSSTCGGCHTVSRNGNVIAFTSDAAAGYLQVADAADPTKKRIASDGTRNSSMLALNSDGSRVAVAFDGRLILRDTLTDTVLAEADEQFFGDGKAAFFPEFSADDQQLVVTLSDAPDSYWSVVTGEIATIPVRDDQFGKPQIIVSTPDEVHFYPSWSPDGEWVVFASAPVFSLSYDQPNAHLRVVRASGGAVTDLDNATQGVGNTSTLPKFAPFVQPDGTMFFTFNSKLDYGYLLQNSKQNEPDQRLPQLWLSSFDPRRVAKGDPSSPPIWLPFQSVDQRNHLGLWTERVSCGDDSEQVSVCGSAEICIDSTCHVIR